MTTPAREMEELRNHVVLEAMTVPERIELFRRRPTAFSSNSNLSTRRLANWRHVLGTATDGAISNRLLSLGVVSCELDLIFGDIRPSAISDVQIPDWWSICDRVLSRRRTLDTGRTPSIELPTAGAAVKHGDDARLTDELSEEPSSLEHVLGEWVQVGTDLLRTELPNVKTIISPLMLHREQRTLLEDLSMLARPTLLARLQEHELRTCDSNDWALGVLATETPRAAYVATMEAMLSDGFANLIRQRPALARLLATRVLFWVRSLAEFSRHLELDRPLLESIFNGGRPLGPLIAGGRGVSDSHNGGRSVIVCGFECGTQIVYKPRSMLIDDAWNCLVERFNPCVPPRLRLKSLVVLNRGEYGWMEFCARLPCANNAEVTEYYGRMGSLLALIHALQGNDFHLENVVAAGPHPLAIDLETLLTPEVAIENHGVDPDGATERVGRSVLRTLLLPAVMATQDLEGRLSLGAVGVPRGKEQPREHQRHSNINTDDSYQTRFRTNDPSFDLRDQSMVERADGESVDPEDYLADLLAGYRGAYQSILEHRASWLLERGRIAEFESVWVRVINRTTSVYYRLLLESCSDELLCSGVDRWIHIDRLLVNTESGVDPDSAVRATGYALAAAEHEALLCGDIAYFLAKGNGLDYFTSDPVSGKPTRIAAARLKRSATEVARQQMSQMGESDLRLQTFLMESSYLAAGLSMSKGLHAGSQASEPTQVERLDASDRLELKAWIVRALERIDELSLRVGQRVNWIDAQLDTGSEIMRPSAMAADLYSGRGGLALLLERAYRHLGDSRWLILAREAIGTEFQMARQAYEGGRFAGFDVEGLSGMSGSRSGLIAACWAIGRHEGHGTYRELARTLLTDLDPRIIERDRAYDVIGGSAGFLLLAMQLDREETITGLEPLLGAVGDHLARHATNVDGIGWARPYSRRPLNGFGHGRAGIGLALLEAGTRLSRTDLRELGLSALRSEHELRSDDPNAGWPDLRGVEPSEPVPTVRQMHAWCAGSDGIALSRSAALLHADDTFLRDDFEFAMACMETNSPGPRSHLCCGSSGRAEAWRTISHLTGDPTRLTLASTALSSSLDVLEADPTKHEHCTMGLGLMQGTAGRIWAAISELAPEDDSAILLLKP